MVPAPFCEGLGVQFPRSTLPESLLFTPSEFLRRTQGAIGSISSRYALFVGI